MVTYPATIEELSAQTVTTLRSLASDLKIAGRSKMDKPALAKAIFDHVQPATVSLIPAFLAPTTVPSGRPYRVGTAKRKASKGRGNAKW